MLASFSSEPRQKDKEYFTSANFEELNSIIETVLASTGCDEDTSGRGLFLSHYYLILLSYKYWQ